MTNLPQFLMISSMNLRLSLTLTFSLFLSFEAWSQSLSFESCEQKVLGGKTIQHFINLERNEEKPDEKYLSLLTKIQGQKNCMNLIKVAALQGNGLLEERNPLSAQILETFVNFHHQWLMPRDYDLAPACHENFDKDIFDPLTPAYHLTRALFQEDRNASLAITAYGDLRSVRKGDNPKTSLLTGLSGEDYQKLLGLKAPLDLTGDAPLIGFLFKRAQFWSNAADPNWSQTNSSWEKARAKGELKLFDHQGAGFLGSPSFLIHYAPKGVGKNSLYKSDGQTRLPRRLAEGILRNVLCLNPLNFKVPPELSSSLKEKTNWNHPITQEKQCLNCHYSLDQMAAGMRHLTYLKSEKSCSDGGPQVLVPTSFETSYSLDFWQRPEGDKQFAFSYPVGFYEGERFVGFNQLGRLLSNKREYYSCHVKKYFQFFYEGEISEQELAGLSEEYQKHQNGLKLIEKILSLKINGGENE